MTSTLSSIDTRAARFAPITQQAFPITPRVDTIRLVRAAFAVVADDRALAARQAATEPANDVEPCDTCNGEGVVLAPDPWSLSSGADVSGETVECPDCGGVP